MSAPERIWADEDHWIDYAPTRSDRLRGSGEYTEYIRADLLTAAQAEIARLTAERDRQYDENVARIAAQAKAEAERDAAMAAPAPQAREITVQKAAEVPEVKALVEAASAMVLHDGWGTVQYTDNRMWGDAEAVQSALRALAAMQKEPAHDQP